MNDKDKLAEIFRKFPGIGPRQAKRMVYHLLTEDKDTVKEMSKLISDIQNSISICQMCFRYFETKRVDGHHLHVCSVCNNSERDQSILMIVAKDVDYEAIEKSGVYKGVYFILGGTIPFLSKNPNEMVRTKELLTILPKRLDKGLKEIIFALNATPEGENTTNILEKNIKEKFNVGISKLGRGFSTGTEVEYSDRETLKNAISSRFLS